MPELQPSPKRARGIALIVISALAIPVLLAVGWRWDLKRDVDARIEAIRAAGFPTSGAELNEFYRAVPDEQNAALVITQAIALMRDFSDGRADEFEVFKMPPPTEPLSPRQLDLLSEYVDLNTNALNKVSTGLLLPECRYPVDASLGVATLLPHLSGLKSIAITAGYQSAAAAQEGKPAESLHAIKTQLLLAETLDKEPFVISQLVRIAIHKMAAESLQRSLSDCEWGDVRLGELKRYLNNVTLTNVLSLGYQGEFAVSLPLFMDYERTLRALQNSGEADGRPALIAKAVDPMLIQLTGFGDRDLRFYLRVMETNLARIGPPESLTTDGYGTRLKSEIHRHKYILSAMLLPALSSFNVHHAEGVFANEASLVAIAIEAYRQDRDVVPAALEELTPNYFDRIPADPFDGQPMRYRRLESGYVIYSVGEDGRDDGGREPPSRIGTGDTNSYDLTFIVER